MGKKAVSEAASLMGKAAITRLERFGIERFYKKLAGERERRAAGRPKEGRINNECL